MKVAVLDLGTNTFNLIVGEKSPVNTLHILHSSIIPVKLGKGGINRGEITDNAYNRGIDAIKQHFETIQKFDVSIIKAFGTSAFRTAKNGVGFIEEIKQITGINIETISGDLEAELIYYGVRQTFQSKSGKYLILDIGGGSNEFIIADNTRIYWKKSYPLGIARLIDRFKPSDPITHKQLIEINNYFRSETIDLKDTIMSENITTLVGASGAFETFVAMINEDDSFISQSGLFPESSKISINKFNTLYKKLIHSTEAERSQMKGLEPMRIEMIVLASHFVKFVTGSLGIKQMFQSNFSLKEGAIIKILNQL